MSKAKKDLPDHLLVAVASHLNPEGDIGKSAKTILKTLNKLAKHFRKQQKPTPAEPVAPTAKQARKVLAGDLTAALQPYLAPDGETLDSLSKPVAKAVKKLATHLLKQRRRKAKHVAEGTPITEVVAAPVRALPAVRTPKPAPARLAAAPARRPATPKRPAPSIKPTAASVAPLAAGETA